MSSWLEDKYKKEIIPNLSKKFGYKNVMEIPKVTKVVINRGLGEASQNQKAIDVTKSDFLAITGQMPVFTKAKKSISEFKVRANQVVGCMVTLRGKRMYDFLTKLINIALPKIRDFKGVSKKSFDQNGNYTLGIKEHIIFPEINFDKVDKVRGLDITIVTSSKNRDEAYELLREMGMPFREAKFDVKEKKKQPKEKKEKAVKEK
jgi:large subunit ribosomal protein L5